MSTAPSEHPQAQNETCGFTQGELINLLEKANFDDKQPALLFVNDQYAGQPVDEKFRPRSGLLPHMPRCSKCGRTIDEHAAAATIEAGSTPYMDTFRLAWCDAKTRSRSWLMLLYAGSAQCFCGSTSDLTSATACGTQSRSEFCCATTPQPLLGCPVELPSASALRQRKAFMRPW